MSQERDPRVTLEAACAGLKVDTFGGNCPVQVEGTIDGMPFYFRARGASWSMSIANASDADPVDVFADAGKSGWYYEELWGTWPDAGYMDDGSVCEFILKSVELWRSPSDATVAISNDDDLWDRILNGEVNVPPVSPDRKCPENQLGMRGDGVSFIRGCTAIGPHADHVWCPWREIVPVESDSAFCEIKDADR